MATTNDDQPFNSEGPGEDGPDSKFQLELAANVMKRIIEKNAGAAAAEAFFDDDSFDFEDGAEPYTDPECCDPDEETLPEMDLIMHNIFECD